MSTTHAALARRLAGVGSDATRRVLPQGCFPTTPRPATDLLNANGLDCLGKPQMLVRTHCGRPVHPDEGVDARRQAETETSIDRYSEIPALLASCPHARRARGPRPMGCGQRPAQPATRIPWRRSRLPVRVPCVRDAGDRSRGRWSFVLHFLGWLLSRRCGGGPIRAAGVA
jgi:hypothetical protein